MDEPKKSRASAREFAPSQFFARVRGLLIVLQASAKVFREPFHLIVAFLAALAFFGLYVFVPVWVIPGNTLAFELSIISSANYVLLFALALMTGALFSFELYAWRHTRAQGARGASEGGAGLLASVTGGLLASCGCGIGILLGAVGLGGGALFVVAHRSFILLAMLGVVAVGLYFSARRAMRACATCAA